MKQLELIPVVTERKRVDYPQINRVDSHGIQWIEVNRGCLRRCEFCFADPNYKTFEVPVITKNIVHIVGEGFLYDKDIKQKIIDLGAKKVDKKIVYYGLSQGVDYRLLTDEIANLMYQNHFGIINSKGKWSRGIRLAWDLGLTEEPKIKKALELLFKVGYKAKYCMIFVLINWKIPFQDCVEKLHKLSEWGVKIDDCFWNTTKKEKEPLMWTYADLVSFRRKAREHNQIITFNGWSEYQ